MNNKLNTLKQIIITSLIAIAVLCSFAPITMAEESDDSSKPDTNNTKQLPVMDRTFFIEGDNFTFKETPDGIISVWEGNVRAYSEQIEITTQHLELELTQDDNIKSLKATPEVTIEFIHDSVQALIRGKEFIYNFEDQTGQVLDSVIEFKPNPNAFDWPIDTDYTIYILADSTIIDNGDLIVDHPKLLLNSLDNPEVRFRGKSLTISKHGDRQYLRIKGISVYVLNIRILYCPWTYRRSLTHKVRSGLTFNLPKIAWGDEGLEFDETIQYNFGAGILKNSNISFRFDAFTNDRWYPEIGFGYEKGNLEWQVLYGNEHQKDVNEKKVRIFRNPDFNWQLSKINLFRCFRMKCGFDYGFIEEPLRNVEKNRLGFNVELKRKPIQLGSPKTTLNLSLNFRKSFYSGDEEYQVCTRSAGFKHLEHGKYSFAATYHHREDTGSSPFLYDVEDILDEINIRSRIRLSDKWATGMNGRYDIEKDHFRDLDLLLTRTFKSFQMSIKWDFADGVAGMEFGLPGAL